MQPLHFLQALYLKYLYSVITVKLVFRMKILLLFQKDNTKSIDEMLSLETQNTYLFHSIYSITSCLFERYMIQITFFSGMSFNSNNKRDYLLRNYKMFVNKRKHADNYMRFRYCPEMCKILNTLMAKQMRSRETSNRFGSISVNTYIQR